MTAVGDGTVVLHLVHHRTKMNKIIRENGITSLVMTRGKLFRVIVRCQQKRKTWHAENVHEFLVLEFDAKAAETGNTLAMKYRVGAKASKYFLIKCIAVANKLPLLTENDKDFTYKKLQLLPYRISGL